MSGLHARLPFHAVRAGGKLKPLAQRHLWVVVNDMQLSEDVRFFFGHLVTQAMRRSTD
jgi:hypothetical protein